MVDSPRISYLKSAVGVDAPPKQCFSHRQVLNSGSHDDRQSVVVPCFGEEHLLNHDN